MSSVIIKISKIHKRKAGMGTILKESNGVKHEKARSKDLEQNKAR